MFGLWASKRILLFTGETDLRKGYDGLAALVTAAGENVYGGDLFVFVSSRRTSAKILLWQTGGMMIMHIPREDEGPILYDRGFRRWLVRSRRDSLERQGNGCDTAPTREICERARDTVIEKR
jgi:IS66 Orf2 like protein